VAVSRLDWQARGDTTAARRFVGDDRGLRQRLGLYVAAQRFRVPARRRVAPTPDDSALPTVEAPQVDSEHEPVGRVDAAARDRELEVQAVPPAPRE